MNISIIVAMDTNYLIGKDNKLLWHIPEDLAYFKKHTIGKTVLMGRKTHQSIGFPLPNRKNIIISRDTKFKVHGCEVVHSVDDVLALDDDEIMVAGGASVYEQMLPYTNRLYITEVRGKFEGDSYFPKFDRKNWLQVSKTPLKTNIKNNCKYRFIVLDKDNVN